MDEDCYSDTMPNVVRKELLSDSITKPGTEAVQPLPRQPDEDFDLHIPDEQLSIKSDAAAENRQTVGISPGDFDTYAIAYICKDHSIYMKTSLEETKTVATEVASNSSHDDDMNLEGCGASENDSDASVVIRNDSTAHTETRDPNPMYTQSTVGPPPNDVTPNPMYRQSTVGPPPNEVNPNPMYLQSITEPNVSDGNPCTQPSADICQQEDEVTFMSANNDGNQRLQPYASPQRQGGDEGSAAKIANIERSPCLRPYAVRCLKPFKRTVVESASCDAIQPDAVEYQEEIVESANNDSDPYIQPYAVGYQKDEEPPIGTPDCGPAASDSIKNDVMTNPSGSAGNPPDLVSEERQHVPNALNQNPMYVPNAQHPAACADSDGGFHRYPWYPRMLQFCPHTARCLQQLTAQSPTRCSRYFPILPLVSNSSQPKENHDKKLEIITFGGYGGGMGKLLYPAGVAVSADNEIFVADKNNKRVQVFSITGTYLRHFPTVVPGENEMSPRTVAIDVEPGRLWVAGSTWSWVRTAGQVVLYNKTGTPLKTFGFRYKLLSFPEIAIDVCNNKVILGDGDTIRIFQPNGSLVRSFQVLMGRRIFPICGVALDSEGNVALVDVHECVKVYNHFGEKISEFKVSSGRDSSYQSIFVDPLGRILLASTGYGNNRVDMFTGQGEFVRTVVNMKNPSYIAIGPKGQLVVVSTLGHTVTIFPRHVLFP
uniref:SMP-30/Gluconolactonase/LRE-like region domain-containing protein n=1 Tax=Branchiostoma floridae TaxID=7739 RepID=C3Z080_BRAFL|eukprot:XP_002598127.1 hypothetical protein BRAFLDRAFT_85655 [Branchiostoma floridae]